MSAPVSSLVAGYAFKRTRRKREAIVAASIHAKCASVRYVCIAGPEKHRRTLSFAARPRRCYAALTKPESSKTDEYPNGEQ